MPKELPIRSRDYLGPCTNTEIWDQFQLRSGDVVWSTPPKSGTTWSPAILMMLIHQQAVADRTVWNDSLWLDFLFPESSGAGFKRFLHNPPTDMGTDDLTLASICCHYQSFRDWAHLPNVHFFHYADMIRNPRKQIMRFAEILGLEPADSLLSAIVQASSFGQMKQVTREAAQPADGAFTDPADFFDAGSSNKWEGRLSNDELMAYHARFSDLMDDADRQWLECGFGKS